MSAVIVQASVLYQNEEFLGICPTPKSFNCDRVQGTPRAAWLIQSPDSYEQYRVTFDNPNDVNALTGVWISYDGVGFFLNAASVAAWVTACNTCCGSSPVVAPLYATLPLYIQPLAATYTITREEDNSSVAFDDFARDYLKYIISGTLLKTAYSGGRATYTFSSYKDPIPLGPDVLHSTTADIVTGETSRVFTSNTVATSPGGGNSYFMAVNADGVQEAVLENATLAGLVTAANADAKLGALGTWSTASGTMILTTTAVYGARIVVTIATT